jgi:hypothetical protein
VTLRGVPLLQTLVCWMLFSYAVHVTLET